MDYYPTKINTTIVRSIIIWPEQDKMHQMTYKWEKYYQN